MNKLLELYAEDYALFRKIVKRFSSIVLEDVEELFAIHREALILSIRWTNIQLDYNDVEESKTDFTKWAYQNYRTLTRISESAYGMWIRAREEQAFVNKYGKEI